MNLEESRKTVMQMKECFEKLEFSVLPETEKIGDKQNNSYIEFYTPIKFEDVDNIIFRTSLFYNMNGIELSILLHLDFNYLKGLEIIHLLNQFNVLTGEGKWSLCDNEIEFKNTTEIYKSFSKKYFEQMIKRTICLVETFYPIILKQINCDKNPYDLVYESLLKKAELNMLS